MQLNFLGVVASVQSLYSRMVQRNSGHICLVSSVMGTMGGWVLSQICILVPYRVALCVNHFKLGKILH